MTQAVTSAQMRAIEQAAIASGFVTGLDLMERAGQGVVDAIMAQWPDLAAVPGRAAVLCGPGNNGGDGFVIARLLQDRGWRVDVFFHGEPDRQPPDARACRLRWQRVGTVVPLDTVAPAFRCDLLVDALFGTGLTRPMNLPAVVAAVSAVADGGGARVVSVDVPSGYCADSGRWLGDAGAPAMPSDLVVTFHVAKIGHWLRDDPPPLRTVDIGLDPCAMPPDAPRIVDWPWAPLAKGAGGAGRRIATHKFAHGHVAVLGGGPGQGGAARLAARAALRVGAGLVTVLCPPAALAENAARLDAVMLRPVADAGALADILSDRRISALCIGPGFGVQAQHAALLATVLAARRATVLDADALTLIAGDPALRALVHDGCVMTPHAGEFARLFPDLSERMDAPALAGPAFSRVDATRAAAARAGCTLLLKGPVTVISQPAGDTAIHAATGDRAAPWLATAGSGDVLSGLIAGLMARGNNPHDAAATAAFLHAAAARAFGPGLIADDLPDMIPRVLRDLEADQ